MTFNDKLRRTFLSNQSSADQDIRLDFAWMDIFKKELSDGTKNRITQGNLHLAIYAKIFRECIVSGTDDIDRMVNDRLDDTNYICELQKRYAG